MSDDVRMGSAPNFCPPVEEGITFTMEDERGDETVMEFLGLILHNGRRYGFFFPVTDETPAKSSGEVSIRTMTTFFPDALHAAASSAKKTICPVAAPGEAGRPFTQTFAFFCACLSNTG